MDQACRILVIDDSPMVFKAVKRALEPEGFQVVDQAFNGQEGLEKIEQIKPDLIILDVTMPIMDGIQTAEALFQKGITTKVIMLSAMGDEDLMNKAKRLGVKLFLTKPFKPEDLVNSVRSVM